MNTLFCLIKLKCIAKLISYGRLLILGIITELIFTVTFRVRFFKTLTESIAKTGAINAQMYFSANQHLLNKHKSGKRVDNAGPV